MKLSDLESTGSLYLYSDKSLYHQVLKDFNTNDCLFSKNLIAYVESRSVHSGSFYQKHLLECEICREKVGKYKKLLSSISKQIPYVNPSEEVSLQLKNYVTLAVSSRNKRLSILHENNNFMTKAFFKKAIRDFVLNSVLSISLIKGVLWSLIIFFILDKIL